MAHYLSGLGHHWLDKEQPPKGILVKYTLGHVPQPLWGRGGWQLEVGIAVAPSLSELNHNVIQYTGSAPLVSTAVVFETVMVHVCPFKEIGWSFAH